MSHHRRDQAFRLLGPRVAGVHRLGSLRVHIHDPADWVHGPGILGPLLASGGSSSAEPAGSGGTSYPPETRADAELARIAGLVDLAREGDAEAFGALYDHYAPLVYRFAYYRVGSPTLAEDLVSDTFFRALRSVSTFRWQGKDFGAWLMTIARNLVVDHYKAGGPASRHQPTRSPPTSRPTTTPRRRCSPA